MLEEHLDGSQDDLSARKTSFCWRLVCKKKPIFKQRTKLQSYWWTDKEGEKRVFSQVPKSLPCVLALQQESRATPVQREVFLETKTFPYSTVPQFSGQGIIYYTQFRNKNMHSLSVFTTKVFITRGKWKFPKQAK